MRSVVVVLPASMWAMMPMFRVLSSDAWRAMSKIHVPPGVARVTNVCCLPAIVSEGLVGLSHLVRVFLLLERPAAKRGRVQDLVRELLAHRLLRALARVRDQPANAQRG